MGISQCCSKQEIDDDISVTINDKIYVQKKIVKF